MENDTSTRLPNLFLAGFKRWRFQSVCLPGCLFVRLSPTRSCWPLANWHTRGAARGDARPQRSMHGDLNTAVGVPVKFMLTAGACSWFP